MLYLSILTAGSRLHLLFIISVSCFKASSYLIKLLLFTIQQFSVNFYRYYYSSATHFSYLFLFTGDNISQRNNLCKYFYLKSQLFYFCLFSKYIYTKLKAGSLERLPAENRMDYFALKVSCPSARPIDTTSPSLISPLMISLESAVSTV